MTKTTFEIRLLFMLTHLFSTIRQFQMMIIKVFFHHVNKPHFLMSDLIDDIKDIIYQMNIIYLIENNAVLK